MSPTTKQPAQGGRRLTDAELVAMMKLMKGANSVELKVTIPTAAHRATIQGLPMDPVESQPRQIYFFDTPDLALYRAGVVVRARRIQGGRGDTVIKLRPVDPEKLPSDLRRNPSFNVEVDALPGGFVCSGSFKGRTTGREIHDVVTGKKLPSKIYSKDQRAFYRLHAPAGIELDSLVPLGPTFILKDRFNVQTSLDDKAPPRSMVAAVWFYPDGSRILELSTKCLPNEALGVAGECRAYFAERKVSLNALQQTKTKTALEFYAAALAAEKAGAGARKPASTRTRTRTAAAKTAAARKPIAAAKKPTAAARKPTAANRRTQPPAAG